MNKFKTIMLWVIGIATLSQLTTFSYRIMNTADTYLFYMGLLILTSTWATAAIIISRYFKRLEK